MAAKSSYQVQQLLTKLKNPDADLRFMALNDLNTEARQPGFGIDDATEYQLIDQVLGLVTDVNGEVKSVAVKTLATLVPYVAASRIQTIIDRLVQFTASQDEGVRDIASLGLKMVVAEVQPGSPLATTCCTKLAPEVVKQLSDPNSSAELVLDSLDLISDILSRFESTVRTLPNLQQSVLKAATPLLAHGRAAVRKRTVSTIATLVPTTGSTDVFSALLKSTILPSLQSAADDKLRTSISLVGALARSAPSQIGSKAGDLIPLVLKGAEKDDDEGKEGVLQCLEAFVLKCPTETGPHLNSIVDKATELLKYDPNYAGGDDDAEDEEMAGASDDEDDAFGDDDEFDEDYDDDDDTSWKVRRSATKLLSACISTRPDLLASFYKSVSPALIARFGDREETVRVEVWATYTTLLKQTKAVVRPASAAASNNGAGVYGGASPRSHLKRKRNDDDEMDTEESPLSQLQAQTPAISKSIVKQLGIAKAVPTRQAGFVLLRELVAVLEGGGLETQISPLVQRVEVALRTSDSGLSGAATSLKIEVLAFLALFFRTHHVKTFADELGKLVPLVAASISERFNKIAAEAFGTASALVRVLRPVNVSSAALSAQQVQPYLASLYQATMSKLTGTEADEDVKGKGMQTLGVLLSHAADSLSTNDLVAALSFLRDRLKNEVQRVTAVTVVGQVAGSSSPALKPGSSSEVDSWAQDCLAEVSALLRKVHRPLKIAAFSALDALLSRAQTSPSPALPAATTQSLLADLAPLLSADASSAGDINLVPHALDTLAHVLAAAGPDALEQVDEVALPRVLDLVRSPLLSAAAGPAVDGLVGFFGAFVLAGADARDVVGRLSEAGQNAEVSSVAVVARCVGAVVKEQQGEAEKVVKEQEKVVKSIKTTTNALILSLLTLGEVGRIVDLAPHQATFAKIIEQFSSQSEDVRRSAAFAAGNIAVGNTEAFLPSILQLIQSDDKKRYLALQALKEVIIHSSPDALASISDTLWTPLFENCEAQEEGTRNVAADCLGQLTVINPAKYLPQLQARLSSDSRHTRATVIAALRFTFTNDSTTYDELLAPLIVEFFKLMHDSDLGVRRLALSSLNSAAHNKPYLVRTHLETLVPELYAQTEVDQSLIRIVEMGPFKHKVDDGLDIRKTAYECMHSLLDTCFKQIELQAYLGRVIAGLADEEEVKKLCYVMLMKLAQMAPTAVAQRLDETVPSFTETLGIVLKDNAVKQEAERTLELQKSAVRCLAVLNRLASPATTPNFKAFIDGTVATGKMSNEFKESSRQSQAVSMDLD
ncbi:TIP120 domain-containing protein [Rhodotorula paludigena]|uniref:TIP120 domain-containing protein n=1 Tax=Rhodotorula paludigena TaxID=86838 RepID=UPI00317BFDC0